MGKLVKLSLVLSSLFLLGAPLAACSPTSLKSIYTMPYRGTLVVADPDPRRVMVMAVNRKGDETDVTALSVLQSSDPAVVGITANGSAWGKSAGYANITVSYSDGKTTKTAVIPVTVVWSRGEGRAINW